MLIWLVVIVILQPFAVPLTNAIFFIESRRGTQLSPLAQYFVGIVKVVTGCFESPLQMIMIVKMQITGMVPLPWNKKEEFCDKFNNCVKFEGMKNTQWKSVS